MSTQDEYPSEPCFQPKHVCTISKDQVASVSKDQVASVLLLLTVEVLLRHRVSLELFIPGGKLLAVRGRVRLKDVNATNAPGNVSLDIAP